MDRRTLIAGTLAIWAVPLTARAQRDAKVARVGFLIMARNPGVEDALPSGLAEMGYVEGRDVIIDWRSADGSSQKLEAMAVQLVQSSPDVIVAGGPEARIAAMKATSTIPIVAVAGNDPVAEGWATSLARPGGNVTGFTVTYPELIAKKLELLKQLVPGLTRVVILRDPSAIPHFARVEFTRVTETAARTLRLDVRVVEVQGPPDFDAAFRQAVQDRRQAVVVIETAMLFAHRGSIAELARNAQLPAIGEWGPSAAAGFLATYGADLGDLLRRAATYVDRILKGSKPGTLPIERPTKFQLVINLKTANALRLRIPSSLLQRADQIIE